MFFKLKIFIENYVTISITFFEKILIIYYHAKWNEIMTNKWYSNKNYKVLVVLNNSITIIKIYIKILILLDY